MPVRYTIRYEHAGWARVLRSPGVRDLLRTTAGSIANKAGQGFLVKEEVTGPWAYEGDEARPMFKIFTKSPEAKEAQARDRVLNKAIGGGDLA